MEQDFQNLNSLKKGRTEGYRGIACKPLCKTWVHGSVLGCTSACCHQTDESMTP